MMNKKEFEEMPIDELKRLMVGQLTKIMLCIKNGEKNTYEYGDSDSMPLIARIRMIEVLAYMDNIYDDCFAE